ncbi:hypothetical protein CHUAL_012112 [Chamberlinius hualienensis]
MKFSIFLIISVVFFVNNFFVESNNAEPRVRVKRVLEDLYGYDHAQNSFQHFYREGKKPTHQERLVEEDYKASLFKLAMSLANLAHDSRTSVHSTISSTVESISEHYFETSTLPPVDPAPPLICGIQVKRFLDELFGYEDARNVCQYFYREGKKSIYQKRKEQTSRQLGMLKMALALAELDTVKSFTSSGSLGFGPPVANNKLNKIK